MRRGFTLIELLLAVALAALLSLAILSVFAAGINVYSRLRNYSDIRSDILLSMEKIEKGMRSISSLSKIEFRGEPDSVTFPAVVNFSYDKKLNISPGSISYYVDNSTHYLVSEEKDYSAAMAAKADTETGKGFITNIAYVDNVKFSYYSYDPKTQTYSWLDTWVSEADQDKLGVAASKLGTVVNKPVEAKEIKVNTPLGIRLEIRYDNHGESFVLKRMIFFPLAVSLHMSESVKGK